MARPPRREGVGERGVAVVVQAEIGAGEAVTTVAGDKGQLRRLPAVFHSGEPRRRRRAAQAAERHPTGAHARVDTIPGQGDGDGGDQREGEQW